MASKKEEALKIPIPRKYSEWSKFWLNVILRFIWTDIPVKDIWKSLEIEGDMGHFCKYTLADRPTNT